MPEVYKMSIADDLQIIEDLIIAGKISRSKTLIAKLYKRSKIPSNRKAKFANLANRCGAFNLAMNCLFKDIQEFGDDMEVIKEYTTALLYLGCQKKALELTETLKENNHPFAYFLSAFGQMKQWNFAKAATLWPHYLKQTELNEYQVIVGKLNYAYCLNESEQAQQAIEVIEDILQNNILKGSQRLHLNARQVRSQILYNLDDKKKFRDSLLELEKDIKYFSAEEKSSFQRWMAISNYYEDQDIDNLVSNLEDIYQDCVENKHFEIARECQYQLAIFSNNNELLKENYIGSPYPSYRELLLKKHPNQLEGLKELEKDFNLQGNTLPLKIFDLQNGQLNGKEIIDIDSVPGKMLQAILSDFHRPLSAYELFEKVFQGEVFNPDSSLIKIRTNISRLNSALQEGGIDLEITSRKKSYTVNVNEPLRIKTYLEYRSFKEDQQWGQIIDFFAEKTFKTKELKNNLQVGEKKAAQIIRLYLEEDKLEKIGQSSNTCYKIKKAA